MYLHSLTEIHEHLYLKRTVITSLKIIFLMSFFKNFHIEEGLSLLNMEKLGRENIQVQIIENNLGQDSSV